MREVHTGRRVELEYLEPEPFAVFEPPAHHVRDFEQLQWPSPADEFEEQQDRHYEKEYKQHKKQQARGGKPPPPKATGRRGANPLNSSSTSFAKEKKPAKLPLKAVPKPPPKKPLAEILQAKGGELEVVQALQGGLQKGFLTEDEEEQLVYPRYKYNLLTGPTQLYVPGDALLFRLIRAAHVGAHIEAGEVAGNEKIGLKGK